MRFYISTGVYGSAKAEALSEVLKRRGHELTYILFLRPSMSKADFMKH